MARTKLEQQESHRTMQVVNHVRALIENGTLKPGDKIPPERDLARELQISRASLRTGIGYLAALGVMKIKHGVGTFIADGPPDFGQDSLSFIGALHGFQSWQMFEARILLETGLAALAAERSKDEHLASLAEEVAEMFAAVDSPADYLIHRRRKTVERSIDLRESAGMHREIYRAIRSRKPAEARRLMEQHLRMAQEAQGLERPVPKRIPAGAERAALS
jgi:GntR family transcriptional repressor for pyruvate dehydrogenase complex